MCFGDLLMRKLDFITEPTNGDETVAFITEKTCILGKWEGK